MPQRGSLGIHARCKEVTDPDGKKICAYMGKTLHRVPNKCSGNIALNEMDPLFETAE